MLIDGKYESETSKMQVFYQSLVILNHKMKLSSNILLLRKFFFWTSANACGGSGSIFIFPAILRLL